MPSAPGRSSRSRWGRPLPRCRACPAGCAPTPGPARPSTWTAEEAVAVVAAETAMGSARASRSAWGPASWGAVPGWWVPARGRATGSSGAVAAWSGRGLGSKPRGGLGGGGGGRGGRGRRGRGGGWAGSRRARGGRVAGWRGGRLPRGVARGGGVLPSRLDGGRAGRALLAFDAFLLQRVLALLLEFDGGASLGGELDDEAGALLLGQRDVRRRALGRAFGDRGSFRERLGGFLLLGARRIGPGLQGGGDLPG